MKLSTKCRYGARAIVEIAKNYPKFPTKRRIIVQNQEINDSYLENILITLRDAEIIDTIRGVNGGYVLKRNPRNVTLLDIFEALNGPVQPVDCVIDIEKCHRSKDCITRPVWIKMKKAQEKVLRDVSIADLLKNLPKNENETL